MKGIKIRGYAAVFDEPDSSGDIIGREAFVALVAPEGPQWWPPMLFAHDATRIVGRWNTFEVDEVGLSVSGELLDFDPDVLAMVQHRALYGLSIGYEVASERQLPGGRNRVIEAISLLEVSVVAIPLHKRAVITRIG